jgi:hypothetical protein
MGGQGLPALRSTELGETGLAAAGQARQHLLDFDRDAVAIDQHYAANYWREF